MRSLKRQAGFLLNPARFGQAIVPTFWDATTKGGTTVLSSDGLRAACKQTTGACSTTTKTSGKSYIELKITGRVAPAVVFAGLYKGTFSGGDFSVSPKWMYFENSTDSVNYYGGTAGGTLTGADFTFAVGDTLQLATDHDAGTVLIGRNNAYKNSLALTAMAGQAVGFCVFSPSTGTNVVEYEIHAYTSVQTYAPPAGYTPWDGNH